MEEKFWIVKFSTLILFLGVHVDAFNLDTKVPIVKEGVPSSYFGFSVAQHQIYDENLGRSEHVILVGAPLDNVTLSTAPDAVKNIKSPGVVYSCPFTSFTDDCQALAIDIDTPGADTIKEDQWLGVSLASQGTENGQAVACAHRFTKGNENFRRGLGLCLSMTNTLDEDQPFDPCAGFPNKDNHVDYGMCQAGTSVAVDSEGDALVIGAPGSRSWRGALFKNILVLKLESDGAWYQSPADSLDDLNSTPPAVRYYSYLGISTKIGKVIGGQTTFVTGAPRSMDVGQVLLMLQEGDALTVTPDHYLTGDQFGSWFGCSIELVDLNNDGLIDIVVGAPFYSDENVGGAIYVYMNSQQGITSKTDPIKITSREMNDAECKQLNCINARFGHSIIGLGDVDRDGFNDIAVGAPFEGNGVVYIFRGTQENIMTVASQRIAAEDLQSARPLTTFGYALSAGNDMDRNGYPDLVVGSFDAHKAVILRARPVINIQSLLISSPDRIDTSIIQCKSDGRPNNCFEIRVCFRFTAEPKEEFTTKLPITFKLEAERYTGRVKSRVFFKGTNQDDFIERDLDIKAQGNPPEMTCIQAIVYIIENNKDFLNPIPFRLTYWLKGIETPTMVPGDTLPPFNTYPVLNEKTAEKTLLVPFKNNCGDDKRCSSDLNVHANFPDLKFDEEGLPVLNVGEGQNVNDELRLLVKVKNKGEDAHEATLYITLPENINYVGTTRTGEQYTCTPMPEYVMCNIGNPLKKDKTASFIVRLNTKNISPTTRQLIIGLNATTTSDDSNNNNVDELTLRVVVETDLSIDKNSDPLEVFYGGEVKGEFAMKVEQDIGDQVIHSYVITNEARGKVTNTTVMIDWPYEVNNKPYVQGKHLLYLLEEPFIDGIGSCETPSYGVDPLGIQLDSRLMLRNARRRRPPPKEVQPNATVANTVDRNRRKREAENIRDSSGHMVKAVILDCDKGTAQCFKIKCTIDEIKYEESVVIKLRSRLWNSTFLEDYKKVDMVYIYSKAEIIIDPALNIKEVSITNNVAKALTKAIPDIQVQDRPGIPLWAIIVAAIAGLLLLILLIIILWKCGFFQRRRHPDDMKTHKGQLKKQNYDDDYYN